MNRGPAAWAAMVAAMYAAALGASPVAAASRAADKALESRLRAHIAILASDDFEGREPGTDGEAKTLRYLGRQWYEIGLVSGTNDPAHEWFAPVTLVAREPAASSALFRRGERVVGVPGHEVLVLTSGKRSLVRNAPLLFVGKGDAGALSRNDLAGRIAVMLDGTASAEGGVEADGERQNALLAAGASGVLTILDGPRSLDQVAVRRKRSGYALADDTIGGDLEAFITRAGMETLLKGGAHSLAELERSALRPGFVHQALGLSASLEATTRETTIRTHNLIGKLPGRNPDQGAVLLVAHWDHFGRCAEPPAEDQICNGAIDNASGVAALTEIARRLARGPRLDRDVYFLATTAEELGLLGAHAFAENPPLPLTQIVAAFNIDSIALAPRGTPLGIVGRGMTDLDKSIEQVARREQRRILPGNGANEYVRRQDGWALLQHDVPAVMVTATYGDIARVRAFFDTQYHRPSDDMSLITDLGGAAQDVDFHVALARWFADTRAFPKPAH